MCRRFSSSRRCPLPLPPDARTLLAADPLPLCALAPLPPSLSPLLPDARKLLDADPLPPDFLPTQPQLAADPLPPDFLPTLPPAEALLFLLPCALAPLPPDAVP
ncbi:hypothetical protein ZIOFF_032610 [Zingiber officinale]|uniref:Uncharacterized protein n=1 Tax=Zingiber officinale TaxID=94328 RepID=A0A8J5GVV6_ZINOF|nr:hypothetical protein ZIOFF_032610 [Zingiber officinale]